MPTRPEGVYPDGKGGWYVKVTLGRDPFTGKRTQITKRGFKTAAEAGRARRELLGQRDGGQLRAAPTGMVLNQLLDLYFDGLAADGKLSQKTLFDYRHYADDYIRPHLGTKRVRDITPELVLAWQRKLLQQGGTKHGKPLAANTVRLARAPLNGAFKLALSTGIIPANPTVITPRPTAPRSIPRYWSPEQARKFLALMEGDRTWPVWAFLLGSGLRIGELVALRWPNVDMDAEVVRVVEFVSTLGYDTLPSRGKSRDAVRTVELDDGLVAVLRRQRAQQAKEKLASAEWVDSDYVFTKPAGGPYHPQFLSRMLGACTSGLDLPRLTAHGLRHTSATLMQMSDVAKDASFDTVRDVLRAGSICQSCLAIVA